MSEEELPPVPTSCPTCASGLLVTECRCSACGTHVAGTWGLHGLAAVPEPHASLLELFLRVRGNMKEMERELGLSYPTVRARLEDALAAAGLDRLPSRSAGVERRAERMAVLDSLERGEITSAEAVARLQELKRRRSS